MKSAMWNNQVGVLEMLLEFFHVHFPDAHLGTDHFKTCLQEVLASYEKRKGDLPTDKSNELNVTDDTTVIKDNSTLKCDSNHKLISAQLLQCQNDSTTRDDLADKQEENEPSSANGVSQSQDTADYFPCAFCGEIFPTHAAYEGHANCHHTGETRARSNHECDVCGRGFENYLSFKRHRINHILVKPFTCDMCSRSFTRNHDLQRHKANVHRIRSFLVSDAVRILNRHVLPSCQRCKRHFPTRATLDEHLQSRKCFSNDYSPSVGRSKSANVVDGNGMIGGSGPFLCERCGMTYEQSGHLAEHRRSASCVGGPPRPPPNVTFPSESMGPLSFASDCLFKLGQRQEEAVDVRWKMEVAEESEEEHELACEHCSATFRLETDLVEHRILEHTPLPGSKRQHSSDGSPDVSMDGNEETVSKRMMTAFPTGHGETDDVYGEDDLEEEEEDEEEEEEEEGEEEEEEEEATDLSLKPKNPCVSEPPTSLYSSKMTDGEIGAASELGMDVWVCVYCSHSFCNKATLDRHMRTHTGEKPFQCPVCVKRFTRKHDLERHRSNIHEGVRPFTCPYCPKTFPLKKNLSKHLVMTHRITETASGSPSSAGQIDVSM